MDGCPKQAAAEGEQRYNLVSTSPHVVIVDGLLKCRLGGVCLVHVPRAMSNGNIEMKYVLEVVNVLEQHLWLMRLVPDTAAQIKAKE